MTKHTGIQIRAPSEAGPSKNRIRELRREARMTQVRLSIELEVAQETVSAYENQRYYPSFLHLVRLSELFHASIDYIMGLSDVRAPTEVLESDELLRLITLGKRLDRHQVALVTAYAQGMLDTVRC